MDYLEAKSENFIKNIIALRKMNGLKQDEQADKYGLGRTGYASYEQGKSKPGFDTLLVIASANGVSIDELLSDDVTVFINKKRKSKTYVDMEGSIKTVSNEPQVHYKREDLIPLIPMEAIAGQANGFDKPVLSADCEYYSVPEFNKKADFLIRIHGSSMYPKYNSGDIVACKKVKIGTFFQWNKTYVLDTEQGPLVKRVKPSDKEGYILLVSDNASYDQFEIPLTMIHSMALIVGVIRFE